MTPTNGNNLNETLSNDHGKNLLKKNHTPPTIEQLLMSATAALERTSSTPRLDAEVLLAIACSWTRTKLLCSLREQPRTEERRVFDELIQRRMRREPIAYLLHHKEFFGIPFSINHHVLVPRPETESLVERAIEFIDGITECEQIDFCDVGTGSGCIMTSIAKHTKRQATWTGIDIDPHALTIAHQNFHANTNVHGHFLQSDLFENLPSNDLYHCITANLPYLSSTEYTQPICSDIVFEPKIALTDGKNGCSILLRFLETVSERLRKNGAAFMEFAPSQWSILNEYQQTHKLPLVLEPFQDLMGIQRFCKIQKRSD